MVRPPPRARSIDWVYPVFLRLTGRRVLVVGAGPVAARRIDGLLAEGAQVVVVAPQAIAPMPAAVEWRQRAFRPEDLDGVWLVQACATPEVNATVAEAAQQRGVWCVDAADAEASAAWTGSTITGPDGVAVAVSGGGDPARAKAVAALRSGKPSAASTCDDGATAAGRWHWSAPDPAIRNCSRCAPGICCRRPTWWSPTGSLRRRHWSSPTAGSSTWARHLATMRSDRTTSTGSWSRRPPRGNAVVRLKGGDPFVLGRGGEELAACLQAGIEVEVVPGITSAVAVPGAAGIPVTHRGLATGFLVATAHGEDPASVAHLAAIPPEVTIVLLMGVRSLQMVVSALLSQRSPDTPAAIVERGWTPQQRTITATLATVVETAERQNVRAPSIVVVGEVAALHEQFGDVGRISPGAGLVAD